MAEERHFVPTLSLENIKNKKNGLLFILCVIATGCLYMISPTFMMVTAKQVTNDFGVAMKSFYNNNNKSLHPPTRFKGLSDLLSSNDPPMTVNFTSPITPR